MHRRIGLGDPADDQGCADRLLKVDRDRNRSADPNQRRLLSEGRLVGCAHGLGRGVIHAAGHRRRGAKHVDRYLDSGGGQLLDLLLERGKDRLPILVRHQPHAHLGRRARGDDCFLAFADETAHYAVSVERGAAAGALQREETFLAFERPRTRYALHRLDVPRVLLLPVRELFRGGPDDRVVEARDRDVAVAILQLSDDAGQGVDRVGCDAAVDARVQVDGGAGGVQLDVEQPSKGGGQGRVAVFVEAAVPDQHRVGLEARSVGSDVAREGFATDLLFALEDESEVDGWSAGREEVLDRLDRGHMVALVVRSTAREQAAIADLRLEWG